MTVLKSQMNFFGLATHDMLIVCVLYCAYSHANTFLVASESAEDAKEQAKKLVKSGVCLIFLTEYYRGF